MTPTRLTPVRPRPDRRGALGLLLLSLVTGCSTLGVRPQQLEDGTFSLECDGSLANCVRRAEEQCGDARIEVLGGRLRDGRVGHGGAGAVPTIAEVHFLCASGHSLAPSRLLRRLRPPANPSSPEAAPTGTPTAPLPARERICDPGATQTCFGPGACEGGQSCLQDGSAFGPCDCVAPPPSAPGTSDADGVAP